MYKVGIVAVVDLNRHARRLGGCVVGDKAHPHNPRIAEVFYYAGYVEESGTGTLRMIRRMKEAGLPEPEFKEEYGGFSVYLYKDVYTEDYLNELGLSERQIAGVLHAKRLGRLTNKKYRELVGLSDEGARMDLSDLVRRGLLEKRGKGRGAHYVLRQS